MDLKNAVAVCLISLFSATLVVLIARSLDSQAASRLEPQLASIVEELRALRGQGGVSTASGSAADVAAVSNGLVVYYFHSNMRCPTCQSIESQAEETVRTHFASQLKSGEMTWKVVNYEQPAAKSLATKFEIQMPVVVLAKMKDGQHRELETIGRGLGGGGRQAGFHEVCTRGDRANAFARQESGGRYSPDAGANDTDSQRPRRAVDEDIYHSDSIVNALFSTLSGGD